MEKEIVKRNINHRMENALVMMISEARSKYMQLHEAGQKDFMDFFERKAEETYKSAYLLQELQKLLNDINGKKPEIIRAYLEMCIKMITVTLTTFSPRLLAGTATAYAVASICRIEVDQKLLQEYKRLLSTLDNMIAEVKEED